MSEQIRVNKFVAMSAAAEEESTSVGQEMSARVVGAALTHATPITTLRMQRPVRRSAASEAGGGAGAGAPSRAKGTRGASGQPPMGRVGLGAVAGARA